ncbi:MAG: hypothetical protein E6J34_11470 [Chloroflexi bacterium]|nr:MAG: hypothetical protein E6J34_11470 [Chloroflexota bacterium]
MVATSDGYRLSVHKVCQSRCETAVLPAYMLAQ